MTFFPLTLHKLRFRLSEHVQQTFIQHRIASLARRQSICNSKIVHNIISVLNVRVRLNQILVLFNNIVIFVMKNAYRRKVFLKWYPKPDCKAQR
jgi:hypothetical protein